MVRRVDGDTMTAAIEYDHCPCLACTQGKPMGDSCPPEQLKGYTETRTPFAIICREHGRVYLTEHEYHRQMDRPDRLWQCPCGKAADWDDTNYEEAIGL